MGDEPSLGLCHNDPNFVTLKKGKNCKTLLNKLKPKALIAECAKRGKTATGKRSIAAACPALCNPAVCCTIDTDFVAILKNGDKRCKKLLEPLKKNPEKLKSFCERTVPTTILGDVVIKNHCSNFCNTGCKPPINCDDKSIVGKIPKKLIVPNKLLGTTSEMTCGEFFEGKTLQKYAGRRSLDLWAARKN